MSEITKRVIKKLIEDGAVSSLKIEINNDDVFLHRKFKSKSRKDWEYDTYLFYGGKYECDCFPFLKKGNCKHIEALISELSEFQRMLWLKGKEIKSKLKTRTNYD